MNTMRKEKQWLLLNYTRLPINRQLYDPQLAYSMHLALGLDQQDFQPLNHNSGVLFAKATEREDGSLNIKSLKNPWLFPLKKRGFGVAAIRTEANGETDQESLGAVLVWTTNDLLEYEEKGLLVLGEEEITEIYCSYNAKNKYYQVVWCTKGNEWYLGGLKEWGKLTLDVPPCKISKPADFPKKEVDPGRYSNIEGIVPHNVISISSVKARRLKKKLLPPVNTGVKVPKKLEVSSPEEVFCQKATLVYNDGTQQQRNVDWDLSEVNFDKGGKVYPIKGRVQRDEFSFPLVNERADPCICRWEGKYYFIATNDTDDNHTIWVKGADSLSKLGQAEEHLILDSHTYPEIGNLLWAPEFHEINGRLYIFHAATEKDLYGEESCIMELCQGGDPTKKSDWSRPKRILKKDGSYLCEAGKTISLDMTCFEWHRELYVVWSQRQFFPKDLGAWLYIAKLDGDKPWMLKTDPVLLSKPEYGWANNHTFVDEAPFALKGNGKLFLTFSSALPDTSYVIGLLTISEGRDLLVKENWKKTNYPILSSRSVTGEYGTGHNSFFIDEDNVIWNVYHARPGIKAPRCSGLRRVHFDTDGYPVLDLTEENALKETYRNVETKLLIK